MRFKSLIKIAIIACIFVPFYANAFNLGDFSKKLLENANNAQKAKPQSSTASSPSTKNKANLPKFNIRGLYLGMPVSNAVEILNSYNPPLKITKSEADISMIRGSRLRGLKFLFTLTAKQIRPGSKGSFDIFTLISSPPNNPDTIMGIERYQNLGHQILISDMKALFTKKYGEPAFESRPNTGESISTYTLSWSFQPNGKPQKKESMLKHCYGANNVLLHANVKSGNRLNFQQCGFTFIVRMDMGGHVRYSEETTTQSYTTILYDGNAIRKAVGRTIEYSEKIAKKLDAEKMEKIKGAKMPQL